MLRSITIKSNLNNIGMIEKIKLEQKYQSLLQDNDLKKSMQNIRFWINLE